MTAIAKTADAIHNRAAETAELISDSSQVNLLIGQEIERRTESKVAPLILKFALEAELKDALDDLPVPGSINGNNPDLYEERVPTGKPGSFRKRKGSFWKDFTMDTPRVHGWVMEHKRVSEALSTKTGELASKGEPWLEAEKKMLSGRITAAVSLVTRAVECHYQEVAIEDADLGVDITYDQVTVDGKKTLKRSERPYILRSQKEDENGNKPYVYLSVGEFLALNPARASEMTGTDKLGNLLSTRKRESEPGSTKFKIKTAETFEDAMAAIAHFFEEKQSRDQMAKWIAGAKKKNKAAIKTFGDVYVALGSYWKMIEGDYRRINQEEIEKESEAG